MPDFSLKDHGAPSDGEPIYVDDLAFVVEAPSEGMLIPGVSYVLVEDGRHVVEIVGEGQISSSANETILIDNKSCSYRDVMMSASGNRLILMNGNDVGKKIQILGRQNIVI